MWFWDLPVLIHMHSSQLLKTNWEHLSCFQFLTIICSNAPDSLIHVSVCTWAGASAGQSFSNNHLGSFKKRCRHLGPTSDLVSVVQPVLRISSRGSAHRSGVITSEVMPISQFTSVQSLSHVQLFVTPWTAARRASLSITSSRNLLKLMSFESAMPSSHLILCCPLLLLPSIFPSIRVFPNESVLHIRWPKYWSFSFSISRSKEYSGLIFRIDWFDLAVQGTLKSLLQHHGSKASILWLSVFFIVQLSDPCVTTGKTIALTRWTFVGKVMSLLFNILLGWSQKTSQADHMDNSLV